MGATNFLKIGKGPDAKTVFDKLVKQAQYDYGHAGYTGTIAEKTEFVMIKSTATSLDERISTELHSGVASDKWGPAGCIELTDAEALKYAPKNNEKVFIFFGWASE